MRTDAFILVDSVSRCSKSLDLSNNHARAHNLELTLQFRGYLAFPSGNVCVTVNEFSLPSPQLNYLLGNQVENKINHAFTPENKNYRILEP